VCLHVLDLCAIQAGVEALLVKCRPLLRGWVYLMRLPMARVIMSDESFHMTQLLKLR
jgi:hypothetical protein